MLALTRQHSRQTENPYQSFSQQSLLKEKLKSWVKLGFLLELI